MCRRLLYSPQSWTGRTKAQKRKKILSLLGSMFMVEMEAATGAQAQRPGAHLLSCCSAEPFPLRSLIKTGQCCKRIFSTGSGAGSAETKRTSVAYEAKGNSVIKASRGWEQKKEGQLLSFPVSSCWTLLLKAGQLIYPSMQISTAIRSAFLKDGVQPTPAS